MLSEIQQRLGGLVQIGWPDEMREWGEVVETYREYVDGDHRADLTAEMKRLLRISTDTTAFNANYCDHIIQTMSDRLTVANIQGQDDAASAWVSDLLTWNRFDGLQMDVHESAVRDGDTFVMVSWDNAAQMPVITHEPAWDGETGMFVIYDRMRRNIIVAVKVWYESYSSGYPAESSRADEESADTRRVNIYYSDRVEKYITGAGDAGLQPYIDDETDERGVVAWSAGVVPVVHFRNRVRPRTTRGISEIAGAIPLQDALNRTLVSMVMTAELSAFQIRVARGFDPPTNLSPGMWVSIGPEGLTNEQVADATTLEQAQLVPFISQAQFLIGQIGAVTRTPIPQHMGGDSSSGEALKQREIGLLGKVARFQVRAGNSWEDVITMCGRIQNAFGVTNAADSVWSCTWEDAQVRNDGEVIQNALAVADRVGERETLRLLASVYGWDEEKIDTILQEKRSEAAANLDALAGTFNGFGALTP